MVYVVAAAIYKDCIADKVLFKVYTSKSHRALYKYYIFLYIISNHFQCTTLHGVKELVLSFTTAV